MEVVGWLAKDAFGLSAVTTQVRVFSGMYVVLVGCAQVGASVGNAHFDREFNELAITAQVICACVEAFDVGYLPAVVTVSGSACHVLVPCCLFSGVGKQS